MQGKETDVKDKLVIPLLKITLVAETVLLCNLNS